MPHGRRESWAPVQDSFVRRPSDRREVEARRAGQRREDDMKRRAADLASREEELNLQQAMLRSETDMAVGLLEATRDEMAMREAGLRRREAVLAEEKEAHKRDAENHKAEQQKIDSENEKKEWVEKEDKEAELKRREEALARAKTFAEEMALALELSKVEYEEWTKKTTFDEDTALAIVLSKADKQAREAEVARRRSGQGCPAPNTSYEEYDGPSTGRSSSQLRPRSQSTQRSHHVHPPREEDDTRRHSGQGHLACESSYQEEDLYESVHLATRRRAESIRQSHHANRPHEDDPLHRSGQRYPTRDITSTGDRRYETIHPATRPRAATSYLPTPVTRRPISAQEYADYDSLHDYPRAQSGRRYPTTRDACYPENNSTSHQDQTRHHPHPPTRIRHSSDSHPDRNYTPQSRLPLEAFDEMQIRTENALTRDALRVSMELARDRREVESDRIYGVDRSSSPSCRGRNHERSPSHVRFQSHERISSTERRRRYGG